MALFHNLIRSVASVVVALFIAHVVSLFVSFFHVFHLAQISIAILAVGGLIFLIAMHHQREGQLLSQRQEEMVLIFSFGLLWLAVLLGWRALGAGSSTSLEEGVQVLQEGVIMTAGKQAVRRERPVVTPIRPVRPYPCSIDDVYCFEEDYTFF